MKRFVCVITIVLITIGLSGCGGMTQTSSKNSDQAPINKKQTQSTQSQQNSSNHSDSNQTSLPSSNSNSTSNAASNSSSNSSGNSTGNSASNSIGKSMPNAASTPTPVSLPTGEPHAFTFNQIDFVNQNIGFVTTTVNQTKDKADLLTTTNGGKTWNKIELPFHVVQTVSFINANIGWGVAKNSDGDLSIVKTVDGGQYWKTELQSSTSSAKGSSSLHMFDASNGWVLINQHVFKTTDGGQHWTLVLKPTNAFTPDTFNFFSASTGYVMGRKVNPSKGSDLAKTYNIKILKTTDGGTSWVTSYLSKASGNVISEGISFSDTSNGWFLTANLETWKGHEYHTSDGGKHWSMEKEVGGMRPYPTEIQFITSQFGWIPYNAGAGPIGGGLNLTRDGGKTFSGVGFNRGWSLNDVQMLNTKEGWATGSSDNLSSFLIHTTDGGKTWRQAYPKLQPTKDIQLVNSKVGYGIGTRANPSAVLKTENGGSSWSIISTFSSSNAPISLSFNDPMHGFLYTRNGKAENEQDLFETNDGGKTWTKSSQFTTTVSNIAGTYMNVFNKNQAIVEKTRFPKLSLMVTTDDGKTWAPLVSKPLNLKGQKGNQSPSFVSPDEGYVLTNDKEQYSLTKYSKGTWSPVHLPQQLSTLRFVQIQQMTFTTMNQGWLYVTFFPSKSQPEKYELLVTKNGGKTWQAIPVSESSDSQFIKMDFMNSKHGWLLTSDGLKYTKDGGVHWTWL